jgi:hypothetical protein
MVDELVNIAYVENPSDISGSYIHTLDMVFTKPFSLYLHSGALEIYKSFRILRTLLYPVWRLDRIPPQ